MDFRSVYGGGACRSTVVIKYAILFILFISALLGAYLLGRSHSELKIVKEQVEVIKYVNKEKAEIYSKPNLSRDAILERMRDNKL